MANTNVASYISPNAASITGVLVAAVAARFFAREELKYRQFGVLLFKVDIWLTYLKIMSHKTLIVDYGRCVTTLTGWTAASTGSGTRPTPRATWPTPAASAG